MGYDEKTAERVRRILSRRRDVVEKKMIGGLSFMVNRSMCCGLTRSGFMVRVGPEALERALSQPHVRSMEFAGRRLAGFVYVDPEGYRTDTALAGWVQRGIDFVSTLRAKKPAARKPRPWSQARKSAREVMTAKKMTKQRDAAEVDARFAAVVKVFAKNRDVIRESKSGFGSGALKVNGKIFAMMSSKRKFVVKLPKGRVEKMVRTGEGERFDPGHGKVMKEWLVMCVGGEDWGEPAQEAYQFVKQSKG